MRWLLLFCGALAIGCAATPPANWARGGANLEIPRARYIKGELMIDVVPDGRVLLNGEHELTIDRAGRVYDPEGGSIALLEPDGRLIGADNVALGIVGALHASRPDDAYAWLSVLPVGEVIRYDEEGERTTFGVWMGCGYSPRANQVCTLIAHMLGMGIRIREPQQTRPGQGVSTGGVGIGLPIGR